MEQLNIYATQRSVPVDVRKLDHQLALRGWTKRELAANMGAAPETVARLYRRKTCSHPLWKRLLAVLDENPPLAGAADLIRQS